MATASTTVERSQRADVEVRIVDCDVHLVPTSKDEILARMPARLRDRVGKRRANATGKETYRSFEKSKRGDSHPPSGAPPGSEPDFVYQQLFGDAAVDLAMLIPEGRFTVDPEINAAWCRAHNEWAVDTWLSKWNRGGRIFGSIAVSTDDPHTAAREIETWAEHPAYKQVIIGDVSERPLGFPQYDPIWAAAARHGLPVAMHFSGNPSGVLGASAVGRYHHHVDYHSIAYPAMYSAHLMSWLCGGVFDRYPDLRIVFVEGGFLWHRPLMTRLERHWDLFVDDVAAKARRPLEYVRDHVRFTSQPIEESEPPTEVARLMQLAGADRTLMFSSDYPHYDFDSPQRAVPPGLPGDIRRRVMFENACELYDLPRTRPADPEHDR
jgi:predicted TIM-barrel fold metal-dependent hydrolase